MKRLLVALFVFGLIIVACGTNNPTPPAAAPLQQRGEMDCVAAVAAMDNGPVRKVRDAQGHVGFVLETKDGYSTVSWASNGSSDTILEILPTSELTPIRDDEIPAGIVVPCGVQDKYVIPQLKGMSDTDKALILGVPAAIALLTLRLPVVGAPAKGIAAKAATAPVRMSETEAVQIAKAAATKGTKEGASLLTADEIGELLRAGRISPQDAALLKAATRPEDVALVLRGASPAQKIWDDIAAGKFGLNFEEMKTIFLPGGGGFSVVEPATSFRSFTSTGWRFLGFGKTAERAVQITSGGDQFSLYWLPNQTEAMAALRADMEALKARPPIVNINSNNVRAFGGGGGSGGSAVATGGEGGRSLSLSRPLSLSSAQAKSTPRLTSLTTATQRADQSAGLAADLTTDIPVQLSQTQRTSMPLRDVGSPTVIDLAPIHK